MSELRFDGGSREFSLVNALACAQASHLAYEHDSTLQEKLLSQWGFDRFKFFQPRPHFGMVAAKDDAVLVVFRGTDEWADWKTNLNFFPRRSPLANIGRRSIFPRNLVHRGFMNATEMFWPDLYRTISDFGSNNQPLWITGHSLGGAISMLAAAKLYADHNVEIAGIYTYGQPPVGGSQFGRTFSEVFPNSYHRLVNSDDAVSRSGSLYRTHHGPPRRWFDSEGSLREGRLGFLKMPFEAAAEGRSAATLGNIRNHAIYKYVELLEGALAEIAE